MADKQAGPIAWAAPWLAPYRAIGEPISRLIDAGFSVSTALDPSTDHRPRFVAQSALAPGEPYEAFIARSGSVPTRDNAHDLFNGLVWLTYPVLKARLNALQVEQLEREGVGAHRGAVRGAVRDALTLFDENAAWLQAPPALIDALRQRDWATLFVTERARWRDARLVLFGHALLEKLMQPRKPITAHVWTVPLGVADPAAWLAERLTPPTLAAKPWLPLPVLGVPGWWNPNRYAGFYDDATVFRRSPSNLKIDGTTA